MSPFLALVIIIPLIITWAAKIIWPHKIQWRELAVALVVSVLISVAIYGTGKFGQTSDRLVINGEVTSKERVHDSYMRSYSCNCVTRCSGSGKNRSCNTSCSTCYEKRFTVNWKCHTNIGSYSIKSLDSTSRSVYLASDPPRYTEIKVGDPASRTDMYINYVKAVPDSLFHKTKVEKFANMIPEYPGEIYDIYKIDRAVSAGVAVPDIKAWNADISNLLRKLGPQRQANVIVVFANTADQSYLYALEGAWIGGKKNDIIVTIGTTSYPKIDWVGVSAWTDRELFKVTLRDDIMQLGTIDREKIIKAIDDRVMSLYVRKPMEDFKYLEDKIEPPTWVLTLAIIIGIVSSGWLSYVFYKQDPFTQPTHPYLRNRKSRRILK